jgi:hypothetical protein
VNPGVALDYVLFQNGTATLPDTLGPSILALFIPEINNDGYGRVRAIVRDESDVLLEQEGAFPLYLDSNNCVSDGPTCTNNTVNHSPIDDGNWHLLSLTTLPQTITAGSTNSTESANIKGYQLYVDGALVGEMLPDQVYTNMLGGSHTSSGGGAPMGLSGDMYLCSRGDESQGRMMSGSLAHLMIWDQPLTAGMMEQLYMDFMDEPAIVGSISGGVNCTTPCRNYDGVGFCLDEEKSFVRCSSMSVAEEEEARENAAGAGATNATAITSALQRQTLCSPSPIPGIATIAACPSSQQRCYPLNQALINTAFPPSLVLRPTDIGVCSIAAYTVQLPSAATVPPPAAFFPLWNEQLASFPLADLSGITHGGAEVVQDIVFGSAVQCNNNDGQDMQQQQQQQQQMGYVSLPPVEYGTKIGQYAVNMWFKTSTSSTTPRTDPVAIFSQISSSFTKTAGGESIQIFLPPPPPSTSTRTDQDGGIEADITLVDGTTILLRSDTTNSTLSISDGNWHMVTLTTTTTPPPPAADDEDSGMWGYGFSLYVDGTVVAEDMSLQTVRAMDSLDREIILCTMLPEDVLLSTPISPTPIQQQQQQQEYFDGMVAYVGLYDYELSDEQIAKLYSAVNLNGGGAVPFASTISAGTDTVMPANSTHTSIIAVTGEMCQLPLTYNGISIEGCVAIAGRHRCWATEPSSSTSTSSPTTSPSASDLPPSWVDCPEGAVLSGVDSGPLGRDDSSVPVFSIPIRQRWAINGERCALPAVVDGVVIDGCLLSEYNTPLSNDGNSATSNGGVWSCPLASGEWAPCDLSRAQPTQEESSGALMVAKRTSSGNGSPCLLPAVLDGRLFFDCATIRVVVEDGQMDGGVRTDIEDACPLADGSWAICAPLTTSPYQSGAGGEEQFEAFNPTSYFKQRTGPGYRDQLCSIDAISDGGSDSGSTEGCQSGLLCVPLPDLDGSAAFHLAGMGFCAVAPQDPVPEPLLTYFEHMRSTNDEGGIPVPLAFFPLTGGSLSSLTIPTYRGAATGRVAWINDVQFGQVPYCRRNMQNAILLENVPYGRSGSFAVNFWMRRVDISNEALDGRSYGYLFAHSALNGGAGEQESNRVSIYVPERQRASWGTVRAFVRDNDDGAGKNLTYVDSDGLVQSETNRRFSGTITHGDINNGSWHMVTLSTLTNGTKGFDLYVDGSLEASLGEQSVSNWSNLPQIPGGGDSFLASGPLVLCSRSDLNVEDPRFFDGAITHLSLFNQALNGDQVRQLFQEYNVDSSYTNDINGDNPASSGLQGTQDDDDNDGDGDGDGLSSGAIAGIVIGTLAGVGLVAGGGFLVATKMRQCKRSGGSFTRFDDYTNDNGTTAGAAMYSDNPFTSPTPVIVPPSWKTSSSEADKEVQISKFNPLYTSKLDSKNNDSNNRAASTGSSGSSGDKIKVGEDGEASPSPSSQPQLSHVSSTIHQPGHSGSGGMVGRRDTAASVTGMPPLSQSQSLSDGPSSEEAEAASERLMTHFSGMRMHPSSSSPPS